MGTDGAGALHAPTRQLRVFTLVVGWRGQRGMGGMESEQRHGGDREGKGRARVAEDREAMNGWTRWGAPCMRRDMARDRKGRHLEGREQQREGKRKDLFPSLGDAFGTGERCLSISLHTSPSIFVILGYLLLIECSLWGKRKKKEKKKGSLAD